MENPGETIKKLLERMERCEKAAEQREKALLETLAKLTESSSSSSTSSGHNLKMPWSLKMPSDFQDVSSQIDKFIYNPEELLTFDRWFRRVETIFASDKGKNISETDKLAIIRSKLSLDEYNQFESHILPKKPQELSLLETTAHLSKLYSRKESLIARRFRAWQTKIKHDEDFMAYASRIKKIGQDFDVNSFKIEDLLTQLFVQGLDAPQHTAIRKKLLERTDEHQAKVDAATDQAAIPSLTVDTLAELAQRLTDLDKVNKSVESNAAYGQEVSAINRGLKSHPKASQLTNQKPPSNCYRCGELHWSRNCPWTNHACSNCNIKGHKESQCASAKEFWNKRNRVSRTHEIKKRSKYTRKFVRPQINGVKVSLKHDTGADWTMISTANWTKIGRPTLTPAESSAVSASGEEVKVSGKFSATIEIHGSFGIVDVYVSSVGLNLFGNDAMEALKLWDVPISAMCCSVSSSHQSTLEKVRRKFPNLFSSYPGKCNRATFSLNFKKDAKVPFMRARSVAYSARKAVEDEIRRLESDEIITQINYADAAAPIVAVKKKNGNIRIAADYSTGLNRALQTYHYPLPTAESIFAMLSGKDTFSTIDLSNAYLQIELDEEAKRFMCINTHVGLFQVNRMQPGVKTASGNFQQILDSLLSGTGALAYQDDIIVPGKGKEDHEKCLHAVLQRLEKAGFTLSVDKCTFAQPQIKFLGRIIDEKGIRPDPEKLSTVKNLPQPTDISQLRSFLGAINWYGTFLPLLKDIRGPLDNMLCKGEKFIWTNERIEAFSKIKKALHSNLALVHYDEKLPWRRKKSSYGIGATLLHRMQDGSLRPIAHAATSFNDAEKNYPQVEREALALVYAIKKFHQYIYGKSFELHTDHKPLLKIFGNKSGVPVHTANRLRRYALTLMGYDFRVVYIKGENFAYADFVSRLIDTHAKPGAEDIVIASIRECTEAPEPAAAENSHSVDIIKSLPITREDLKQATAECDHLQSVIKFVKSSWPQKIKQIRDPDAAEYFHVRFELSVIDETLYFQDVPVIPPKLRKRILEDLHDSHPGCSRMQALAREYCYWPGYCHHIQSFIQRCDSCAVNAKTPRKEILHPWPKPERPWQRIHIDFAEPSRGDFFFVAVDAFSNWPEVFRMKITSASKTVAILEEMFARWGPPATIVSDNGPQFISSTFKDFCSHYAIEHILTAPYHPQSNDRAERYVDILKTNLRRMDGEGNTDEKLRCFLMNYRKTPTAALGGKSPFELMTGRKMPSRLDILAAPAAKTHQESERASKMAHQFNKHHGAVQREFKANEPIYYKLHQSNKWTWQAGPVTKRLGPTNYLVQLGGRNINAHANQLKQRFISSPDSSLDVSRSYINDFYSLQTPEVAEEEQIPVQENNDSVLTEDDFTSAEEDNDGNECEQEETFVPVPEPQPGMIRCAPSPEMSRPRRTTRPPAYLNDFERNLDNAILVIRKLNLAKI